MMIDLSVPRNIDPQLPNHFPITLLNVDQLNRGPTTPPASSKHRKSVA